MLFRSDSTDPVTIERVTPEDISVYAGYMYLDPQFEICYTPENAKQKTKWTSSDTSVLNPSSSMTSVTAIYRHESRNCCSNSYF